MFERLNTPQELFNHQLCSALDMEQKILEMLADDAEEAQDETVKQMLLRHREESQDHVRKLEQVFALFGWEPDTTTSPAIRGIEKEGKLNAKKTDDSLVDHVLLSGAAETEHHEIAVYEDLITHARAMGRDEAVTLLRANLENEEHTLRDVQAASERLAALTAAA